MNIKSITVLTKDTQGIYVLSVPLAERDKDMYYIAICDDDLNFIAYIKKMIIKTGIEKVKVKFYEYSSGEELVANLEHMLRCDLLLLDMKMKQLDGNETAKQFRRIYPTAILVFCSGYYLPTIRCFEVRPFRYLLKNFTNKQLLIEMKTIVKEMIAHVSEPFIIGSYYHNIIRLKPSDILYIEIAKRGSRIHIYPDLLEHDFEQKIIAKEKVADLYEQLKAFGFAYAHNSYIVNLKYIVKLTPTELQLQDGTVLSVSRSKTKRLKQEFIEALDKNYK